MDKIIIRKAKIEELEIVQKLNHELFLHDEEYDPMLNMNWPFEKAGETYFRNKITEKTGVCFVAVINNEIVGYMAGGMAKTYPYRKIKKQSELENILVKEEYRGKKIGELLFKEFIKWSKAKKAERIKVSTSFDNAGAVKFYKRVGFIPYATELEYDLK
jgi:ribosomal protein S18 acetylase RimI-like enzyme